MGVFHFPLPTRCACLSKVPHALQGMNSHKVIDFLVAGNDADYSVRSPYIIWHHERPGFICSVGFFISITDLSATTFLPDKDPKAMLKNKNPISLAPFIKRLPQLLPQMLRLKGFYSFQSLLLRSSMIK